MDPEIAATRSSPSTPAPTLPFSRSVSLFSWPSFPPASTSVQSTLVQPLSAPASFLPALPLFRSPSVSSLSTLPSLPILPTLSASVAALATPSRTRKSWSSCKKFTDPRVLSLQTKVAGRRSREKCHQIEELSASVMGLQTRPKGIGNLEEDTGSSNSTWEFAPHSRHMVGCPSMTPLAAPASPRPIRCFNASPRPWIARKYNSVSPVSYSTDEDLPADETNITSSDGTDCFSRMKLLQYGDGKDLYNPITARFITENRTAEIIRGLREVVARRKSRIGSAPDISETKYDSGEDNSCKDDIRGLTSLPHQRRLVSMEKSLDYIDAESIKDDSVDEESKKPTDIRDQDDSGEGQWQGLEPKAGNELVVSSNANSATLPIGKIDPPSSPKTLESAVTAVTPNILAASSCVESCIRKSMTRENVGTADASYARATMVVDASVFAADEVHSSLVASPPELSSDALCPDYRADDTGTSPSSVTSSGFTSNTPFITSTDSPLPTGVPNTTIATDQNKQSAAPIPTPKNKRDKKESTGDKQWRIKTARKTIKETLERKFHSHDDLTLPVSAQSVFRKSPIMNRSNGNKKDKTKSKIPFANQKKGPDSSLSDKHWSGSDGHVCCSHLHEGEDALRSGSWSSEGVVGRVFGGPSKFRRPGVAPPGGGAPRHSSSPSTPQLPTMFSRSVAHPRSASASSACCACVRERASSVHPSDSGSQSHLIEGINKNGVRVQGGSGDGDRPPPVIPTTGSFLQDGLGRAVRRKPDIPDNLAKRRRGHVSPLNTTTSDGSETPVGPLAAGGSSPRVTVNHILASLNFARFRLGDLTSSLSGTKKETGTPPPVRPPRSRHDTDKTRKLSTGAKPKTVPTDDVAKNSSECLGWRRRRSATDGASCLPTMSAPKHSVLTRTHSAPQSQKQVQEKSNDSSGILSSPSKCPESTVIDNSQQVKETPDFPAASQNKLSNFALQGSSIEVTSKSTSGVPKKSLLPPLPRDSRFIQRDIPFRSASVSQTELNSDPLKGGRTSPSLRLHPVCKEYAKPSSRNKPEGLHNAAIHEDVLGSSASCANISTLSSTNITIDGSKSMSETDITGSNQSVRHDFDNSGVDQVSTSCDVTNSDNSASIDTAGQSNISKNSDSTDINQCETGPLDRKNKKVVFGLWPSLDYPSSAIPNSRGESETLTRLIITTGRSPERGNEISNTSECDKIFTVALTGSDANLGSLTRESRNSVAVAITGSDTNLSSLACINKSSDSLPENNVVVTSGEDETVLSKSRVNFIGVGRGMAPFSGPGLRAEARRGSLPCDSFLPHLVIRPNFDPAQNENARESIIQAVNKLMNKSKTTPSVPSEFVTALNERNRQFRRGSSFDYQKNDAAVGGDCSPLSRKLAMFSLNFPINENEASTNMQNDSRNPHESQINSRSQFLNHKCLKRSDGIDISNQDEAEYQSTQNLINFSAVQNLEKYNRRLSCDSERDPLSQEKNGTKKADLLNQLMPQLSDEGISVDEEVRSRQPVLTSDSSSQDSMGQDNYRSDDGIVPGTSEIGIDLSCEGENNFSLLDRVGAMLGPTHLDSSQGDHSLAYPQSCRLRGDIGYSSIDSNGLKSSISNTEVREASEGQSSSVSIADSFPSEGEESNVGADSASLRGTLESHGDDRDQRKLKHFSDPSSERIHNTRMPNFLVLSGNNQNQLQQKCVISQGSTDSEGKDEIGQELIEAQFGQYGSHYIASPQVLLTGFDNDPWLERSHDGMFSRSSRTASPSSYFPDSDSNDVSSARSPHGPRRYSKRPLRGPYGEMLEAEMSKSKANYLSEDMYLPVRDSKSSSPCPHTPSASASPAASPALPHNEDIRITLRSLDDSTIRMFYSEHCPGGSIPTTSPPSVTSCSSEGDSVCDLMPLRPPLHQRTKSSPSKLFCEPNATFEEDQQHSEYYKAARRFISRENQAKANGRNREQLTSPISSLGDNDSTIDEESSEIKTLKASTTDQDSDAIGLQSIDLETQQNKGQQNNQTLAPLHQKQLSLPIVLRQHSPEHHHDQQHSHQIYPQHNQQQLDEQRQQHLHQQHALEHQQQQHPHQQHSHTTHPHQQKQQHQPSPTEVDPRHLILRRFRWDTRVHVIGELYETEKNYVKKLSFLIKHYEQTLRGPEYCGIIDQALVDDIFYQVPDILEHHERFLEELRHRIDAWEYSTCIGDVIYNMVSDPAVLGSYTSFTNNWKNAHDAAKTAAAAKPAFGEFLMARAREHPGKMDLKALLISPVQRFPHYEMLLKRMLKHTPHEHPDAALLMRALSKTQEVTVKINDYEKRALQQEHQQDILRDLESVIEGLEGLVQPERTFLQCDLATMHSALGTRKERCLFLFSDLLLIAAIKRRAGTTRKGSSLPWALLSSLESSKLKLFKFIPLDDLDIARSRDESVKKLLKDIEGLESDLRTVQHMAGLCRGMRAPRASLEEALHEAEAAVRKALADRQGADSLLNEVELTITTQEGVESIAFTFHNPEKRANWEEAFHGAKQKLALSADRRPPPEFVSALPIRKTRAGLQFTCAAATLGASAHSLKDVWVCNSDGYVGQVCVLTLHPEPAVACCNGVCNARILSIASVPAAPSLSNSSSPRTSRPPSVSIRSKLGSSRKRLPTADGGLEQLVERGLDSFRRFRADGAGRTPSSRNDSDSSDDDEEEEPNSGDEGGSRKRRSESLPPSNNMATTENDAHQPTMWLGTEDGFIHVYNCTDTIRIKKNKFKFQLGSSVHCIIHHLDNRVFASLASGEVVVYRRGETSWPKGERDVVAVSTPASPVTKMIMVAGKLWCAAGSVVKILNTNTLQLEHSFLVGGAEAGSRSGVSSMVSAGQGVWLTVQGSPLVRLFHATTHECLAEASVAAPVAKMLAASPACDDIIRQHKAACLRVTALLACKDLLWVGTSAGVVLTAPIPHLPHLPHQQHHHSHHPHWRSSHHPPHHATAPLNLQAVPHGHTGQVRFLTSVELTPESRPPRAKAHGRYAASLKAKEHHQPGTAAPAKLLVISGGDGYEDFRNANQSELAGRDDSTNHLLMWHV